MTALDLAPQVSAGDGALPPDLINLASADAGHRIVGVDIGNAGGVALMTRDGVLIDVAPMPVLQDGPRSRPTVNGPLLAALLRRWAPTAAFVELVGPRPGEAAGGAFTFGRARGLIEGVLAAQGVPARQLTPATWKRAIGIPAGRDGVKDMARAEACRRWPAMADRFAAKGSDGLAEAALIGWAGLQQERVGR